VLALVKHVSLFIPSLESHALVDFAYFCQVGLSIDCSTWVTSGLISHDDMLDRNWAHWTTFSQVQVHFIFLLCQQLIISSRMCAGPSTWDAIPASQLPRNDKGYLSPLSTPISIRCRGTTHRRISPPSLIFCPRRLLLPVNSSSLPGGLWMLCPLFHHLIFVFPLILFFS
jgi:hypothetical protein